MWSYKAGTVEVQKTSIQLAEMTTALKNVWNMPTKTIGLM